MDKMTFNSLREAKKYISKHLPGGEYSIHVGGNFEIINEDIAAQRRKKMIENDDISYKLPYLRTNGKFI